jgi:hypothetical protein
MLMHSNFEDPLELKDARTIVATGPLVWGPGNAQCRIAVTISQGALSAPGHTGNYNEDEDSWACHVQLPSGAQWDPNQPVRCVGTATPPPVETWDPRDVSLQPQQAATPA